MRKKKKEEKQDTIELFYLNREERGGRKTTSSSKKKKKQNSKKPSANKKKRTNLKNEKEMLKRKKRRKIILFLIKWTTLIALLIGATIFLFTTPLFNLQSVEVVGNKQISYDEIVSLSKLVNQENIFKNKKSDIIKNIKENPYIDTVEVKRQLPNKIKITVKERKKAFCVKVVNGYAYISTQGYILEISKEKENLPEIKGFKTTQEDFTKLNRIYQEDLSILQNVLEIMKSSEENNIKKDITSIDVSNPQNYIIKLKKHKKTVHLGDSSNLSNKMLYIKAIIEEEEKEGEIFVNGNLNEGFRPFFREKV